MLTYLNNPNQHSKNYMKPIIGLTGKMLSGKSEATKYLMSSLARRSYSAEIIKIAGPLYDIQTYIYRRICRTPPTKDRKLLQWLGSEWGRSINPNLWADLWEMDVKTARMFRNVGVVVCDDVRFNNEAMRIRKMGGIVLNVVAEDCIRATRGDTSNGEHQSEKGVIPELITATIYNNGTLPDLYKNIDYLLDTLTSK